MSKHLCWVYHPIEEPMIVDQSQAENLYQQGWFDTPAKFPVKIEVINDFVVAEEKIEEPMIVKKIKKTKKIEKNNSHDHVEREEL